MCVYVYASKCNKMSTVYFVFKEFTCLDSRKQCVFDGGKTGAL